MKKYVKVIITVAVSLVLMLSVCGIVFSYQDYHDKHSWAIFEIVGDGVAEGEYLYKCSPDINVFEGFDWKSYGKGETIELGYASFTINRVDKEGISISSNEDLVYNGEIVHKLFLNKYDGCEIHSQNGKATIKLIGIEIQ